MKKHAVVWAAALIAVLGIGASASAQYGADEVIVTVSSPTVQAGGSVEATLEGCTPGEDVVFVLEDETETAVCEGAGVATASLVVPDTPGTYTGTATGQTSDVTASFTITVAEVASEGPGSEGTGTGALPSTGSDGIGTTATVALGALGVGLALLLVAQIRRRRSPAGV